MATYHIAIADNARRSNLPDGIGPSHPPWQTVSSSLDRHKNHSPPTESRPQVHNRALYYRGNRAQKGPWVSSLFPEGFGDLERLRRKPAPRVLWKTEVSRPTSTPLRRASSPSNSRASFPSQPRSNMFNGFPTQPHAAPSLGRDSRRSEPRPATRSLSTDSSRRRSSPSSSSLPRNVGLPESRPSSKPIQRCGTSNCAVDSKFVQPNGFCAQCNKRAVQHTKLKKMGFDGALEEVPLSDPEFTRLFLELARVREEFKSTALTRPAPSIYGGTEENPNEGSAFGGRLSFSVVQRDFDDHDDPTTHGGGGGIVAAQRRGGKEAWPNKLVVRSTDPGSAAVTSVVNYQLLRLTFLYNKALGQGIDQIEFFQHFDLGCRGEISESQFRDGLKRLGIFLTSAETNAFFQRLKPNNGLSVTFLGFLRALKAELPKKMEAPKTEKSEKERRRELMIKERDKREKEIEAENAARAAAAAAATGATTPTGPAPPKKNRDVDDGELMGMSGRLQKELKRITDSKKGNPPDMIGVFLKKDPDEDGYLPNGDVLKILRTIGFKFNSTHEQQFLDVFAKDNLGFFSKEICYMEVLNVIESKSLYAALKAAQEAGKTPVLTKQQREKLKKKQQEKEKAKEKREAEKKAKEE